MKTRDKLLGLIISLFFVRDSAAQLMLPVFEAPTKIASISDASDESLPFPYNDGNSLYFVRTYAGGSLKERSKGQDVWSSTREGNQWAAPTNLFEEVNDNGNNAVIGTSKDGKTVYVFNSLQTRRRLAKGIAVTRLSEEGEWSDLEKVEVPGFVAGEGFYSFYITPEEDFLLIGMNASDSTPTNDLFVSIKNEEGKWGELKNLGSVINTDRNELSPYITNEGKTLYFSSDGHGGLGEADVFISRRLDDSWTNWTKPQNLGEPINSPSFDAYFIIGNNKEVFFSSNRGQELSDIYTTRISKDVSVKFNQEMSVQNQFNYRGLPAEGVHLEIYDSAGNLVDEVVTDAKGYFEYNKLGLEEHYVVKIATGDLSDYPDGKIYQLDEQGKKLRRLSLQAHGVYVEEAVDDPSLEDELVTGIFKYKDLPMSKTALIVYDENDFPIDTIYTNEHGEFEYRKLKADGSYYIRPMNEEEFSLQALSFSILTGAEPDKEKSTSTLVSVEKKEGMNSKQGSMDSAGEATKMMSDKGGNSIGISPDEWNLIYFNHNEVSLSDDDRESLDRAVVNLQKDNKQRVVLTGHTDNVGTAKNNLRIASGRARAAREYMESKGIPRNRITIYGMGEIQPIARNDSEEGRAKNRRVEVKLISR